MSVTTPSSAPGFTRAIKLTGALLLTLSAVTPASSVFVIIPGIIQLAGTGAFLSMVVAAGVALCMAFVYAELASAFPLAGGEYAMMGHTLGSTVGFVFMGMNTVGSTLAPAVLSLGASTYIATVWPDVQAIPLAIGIITCAMLLGILNIRINAWVTGLFLAVECAALVVLAVLGFGHPHRGIAELATHPVMLNHGVLAPTPVSAIGLATAVAIFAYNGFGVAVYFGEEMNEAPRLVARTILLALGLTVAFEFLPMTAVLLAAPDLKALISSQGPFSEFVLATGGSTLNTLVSLGVALSIVNAGIVIVLVNARFFYSSGRDQVWHRAVNASLVRLHARFDSPWVATLLAGSTGILTCFVPFHLLLVLNGTGVVVMYVLLCVAVLAGRLSGSTAHGAYRMPLFPVPPLIALVALIYVVYANWINRDVGRPSLIAAAAMMVLAAAYCLAMRRRRGPHWAMAVPAVEDDLA